MGREMGSGVPFSADTVNLQRRADVGEHSGCIVTCVVFSSSGRLHLGNASVLVIQAAGVHNQLANETCEYVTCSLRKVCTRSTQQ